MDSQQPSEDTPSEEPTSHEGGAQAAAWSPMDVQVDLRKALLGGALAAAVSVAGAWAVGRVSGAEGLVLLEAMLPTTRFLCSAVMTASATMLALMLTLIGLSANSSSRFHPSHYERIRQIALVDAIAFVAGTVFLLVLNIPLEESDKFSATWYSTAYYVVLIGSSLLGGLLITAVLMLYDTVRDIIQIFGLKDDDHPLLQTESSPVSEE